MGKMIVGIVIFIIIVIIQSKKAKQVKEGVPPKHNRENFPFPMPTPQEFEDWIGRSEEEISKPEVVTSGNQQVQHSKRKAYKMTDEITVNGYDAVSPSLKASVAAISTVNVEYDDFEFDAEKAIIYSEIMNAKYLTEEC